jgi:hypothetical protein
LELHLLPLPAKCAAFWGWIEEATMKVRMVIYYSQLSRRSSSNRGVNEICLMMRLPKTEGFLEPRDEGRRSLTHRRNTRFSYLIDDLDWISRILSDVMLELEEMERNEGYEPFA